MNRQLVAIGLVCGLAACSGGTKQVPTAPGSDTATDAARDAAPAVVHRGYEPRDVSGLVAPEYMHYIPADSPLVIASYEPIPKPFVDKYTAIAKPFINMLTVKLMAAGADGDLTAEQRAAYEATLQQFDQEGLKALGMKFDTRAAIYMVGPSLVLYFELEDGTKTQAHLAEISRISEGFFPSNTLGELTYYRHRLEEYAIAIAVEGNSLTAVLAPASEEAAVLPVAFRQQKPDKSIVDTGALRSVVADYGLAGFGASYLDLQQFTAALTTPGHPLARVLGVQLPAECSGELREFATIAPRLAFGYTGASDRGMSGLMVLELREDLASELSEIVLPAPSVTTVAEMPGAMVVAMGLDIEGTWKWANQKAAEVVGARYRCPALEWANELASVTLDGTTETPEALRGFEGFAVTLTELDPTPESQKIHGHAVVAMDNPMRLVDMVKQFGPPLSELQVAADGQPIAVPVPSAGFGAVHVAVTDQRLGLSFGGQAERDGMVEALHRPRADDAPFMMVAVDYSRLGSLMASANAGDGDPAATATIQAFIEHMGILGYELYMDDSGVVIRYDVELR